MSHGKKNTEASMNLSKTYKCSMSSNYFEVLYKVSGTFLWYNIPLFLTKSLPFQIRQNSENLIFKP